MALGLDRLKRGEASQKMIVGINFMKNIKSKVMYKQSDICSTPLGAGENR